MYNSLILSLFGNYTKKEILTLTKVLYLYFVMCDVSGYILRHVQKINPFSSSSKNVYEETTIQLHRREHEIFSKAYLSLENRTELVHCGET